MNSVLAILGTLLSLATGPAPAPPGQDVAARVDTVLGSAAGLKDATRTAHELAQLGATALPAILERLATSPARDVQTQAILLGAIAQLPRARVLEQLSALARDTQDEQKRSAGLDLLARIGTRGELGLVLELGRSGDPEAPPGEALRLAFERSLLGICSNEPGAARGLVEQFPRVSPSAQTSIASVLGDLRAPDSLGLLASLLGRGSGATDAMLLLELASTARTVGPDEDLLVFERVRDYLGRTDPSLVALACAASDALGDYGAVPDLIVLLEHESPNPRSAAHASLVSLTGLALAPEAELWLAWLDESLAWWDERAEACRIALVSGTPAEAAAALEESAQQRLFVHDVARILALGLLRPEADLVRAVCRVYRALPARAAHATFLALSAHPDPAVQECARAALARSEPERAPRRSTPALPRTKTWTP